MLSKKYGVVSSGVLSANGAARVFRQGAVLEFGPEERQLFVQQAPQNFVELIEGYVWDETVAAKYLPGGEHFQLTFDVEAQLAYQRSELAKVATATVEAALAKQQKGKK